MMTKGWGDRFRLASLHTDAILACGVIGLVLILIVPLPPLLLDTLLSLSIVFSVMALLLTLYVENALEFSVFPSVLLFLTLFRLGLNLASTRMILTRAEAGDLIETFGEFVTQGSLLVGGVIFLLLTLINFFVVTKGAGRIAEVAARFTLEALPGKQMALDSEVSSGLISHDQAKEERKKLTAETDFYGAMDGASKFVKGDAIAGLIITGVNLVGGFIMGIGVKGMGWHECTVKITRLTIGDGLASQIPALLVSLGAAMMVTRASRGSLGEMLPKQMMQRPIIFTLSSLFLFALCMIPGMPRFILLPLAGVFLGVGFYQTKKHPAPREEKKEQVLFASPLEVQLGYQAVIYAQALKEQLPQIREQIASHLGVRVPSVKITDNATLSPTGWVILVKGTKSIAGRDADLTKLATQLTQVIEEHAHLLLNRQDVAQMLQEAKKIDHVVVEELMSKKFGVGSVLKVLQQLLKERVSIRDFVTILEILADNIEGEKANTDLLVEKVRLGLSKGILEEFFGNRRKAYVITLDPHVEQTLKVSGGKVRPKTVDQISKRLLQIHNETSAKGITPVLLTTTDSRRELRALIEKKFPHLPVLSYQEMSEEVEVTTVGTVSSEVLT